MLPSLATASNSSMQQTERLTVFGLRGPFLGKAKFEAAGGAPSRAFRTALFPTFISDTYDLGTLADTAAVKNYARSSEALDLKDGYGTVGRSQNAAGVWRAFHVLAGDAVTAASELPGLSSNPSGSWTSRADSINRHGTKVGSAQVLAGGMVDRAVLWDASNSVLDLNSLLPNGSGWVLNRAVGVSDSGSIVGHGTKNGTAKAFLLAPQRTIN
jgi:hypothetical protein